MPTYRMLLEYDGTGFHGWQIQPGHVSVQEALEQALAVVVPERPRIVGSGRTDAGVHARGQVAHFRVNETLDPPRIRASLNGLLPETVAVLALDPAPDHFHARYDARGRRYAYYVRTLPIVLERHARVLVRPAPDFDAMNRAAEGLLGTHDFSAFCRSRSETMNRVCTVNRAEWHRERRRGDAQFNIVADRFLHGMVRAIVGTLLQIGRGKRVESDMGRILASLDRREAGPAAPSRGLVLEEVIYASN
jgi:tRNA pseudouridine38-40 synthase